MDVKMWKTDFKQQELIEKFYKEETTWCPEHVGYQLLAALFIGISILLGAVPYQVWNFPEDYSVCLIWIMLYTLGVVYYMQKYTNYTEGRKIRSVYNVLRYLPVSAGQLQIYIMKKIVRLCAILTVFIVCCQTGIAVTFMHAFSIGNIFLPLGVNFCLPVAAVGMITTFGKLS